MADLVYRFIKTYPLLCAVLRDVLRRLERLAAIDDPRLTDIGDSQQKAFLSFVFGWHTKASMNVLVILAHDS